MTVVLQIAMKSDRERKIPILSGFSLHEWLRGDKFTVIIKNHVLIGDYVIIFLPFFVYISS